MNDLMKKSIANIRLSQIQAKVNMESEIYYSKKTIGSPMPHADRLEYGKELIRNYQRSKLVKNLW